VTRRTRLRIAVLVTGLLAPVLTAAPAMALIKDDGENPGPSLGDGMTLLLFVVIPLGVFAIITFFALLPSALSRPRYRPGKPWNHDPLWFGGPEDPETALQSARPAASARGGSSAEW
jgi:hypothetical protein